MERLTPIQMYHYFQVFGHLSRDEALPQVSELSKLVADPGNLAVALGSCAAFTVSFFWHPVPGPGDSVSWEPHDHINKDAIDPFMLEISRRYELFSNLVCAVIRFEGPEYLRTLSAQDTLITLAQGMTVCGQLAKALDMHDIDSLG